MEISRQAELAIIVERSGKLRWPERFPLAHVADGCPNLIGKGELSPVELQDGAAPLLGNAIATRLRRLEPSVQSDHPDF